MDFYTIFVGVVGLLSTASAQKVVTASVGTIKGETVNGGQLHRFLGIPYAVAPLDKLRFAKPKKIENFKYPYVADRTRSFCQQMLPPDNVWMNLPVRSLIDEDCLYLNIYVPERNEELPVMVFLEGDNFLTGRGDVFDGDVLAMTGDVIVVTLNYRLGIFGFLTTGDENAPGNIGLWDQNLALHWVQDNIRAFGGDPNRVTLVGWSAGATSAALHALSEESRGLFSRVILQGGGVTGPIPVISEQEAVELAKKFGISNQCYSADDSKSLAQMVDCLQTGADMNPTFLAFNSLSLVRTDPVRGFLSAAWVPVIDGNFLKDDPAKLLSDKTYLKYIGFYDLDIMLGVSRNEGTHLDYLTKQFLAKNRLESIVTNEGMKTDFIAETVIPALVQGRLGLQSIPAQTYIEDEYNISGNFISHETAYSLYTDSYFLAPIMEIAQAHSSDNTGTGNTYLYRFDHSAAAGEADVPHGGELPYVFGLSNLVSKIYQIPEILLTGDSEDALAEQAIRDMVVNYWTNFMKTGNPNKPKSNGANWPAFETTTKNYMKLLLKKSSVSVLEDNPKLSWWIDCFPLNITTLSEACPNYQGVKATTTDFPVIPTTQKESGESTGPSSSPATKKMTTASTVKIPADPSTQKEPSASTGPSSSLATKQTTKASTVKAPADPTTQKQSGESTGTSSKPTTKHGSEGPKATTPSSQKETDKPATGKPQVTKPDNSCNSLTSNTKTIVFVVSSLLWVKYLLQF